MNPIKTTPIKTTLFGAVAGAALLMAPGTASAAPTDTFAPLLYSTCSFGQVDAALHVQAPQIAAQLDGMPEQKAQLQSLYNLPVDQRQAAVDAYFANNPDLAARAEQLSNSADGAQAAAIVQQVADTCHSY